MATKTDWQSRWVLLFLGAGLLAMLLASLWWRFTQPSLTINRFGQSGQQASAAPDNGMAAIGILMENVAKNPHDIPMLLRLTESLMAIGQWDSAENFAQKALDEPPGGNPTAMYLLAVIHHNKGNHAAAAELLEKLLAKQENPSARYSLAILDIHYLDKPEEGRAHLEKGINDDSAPQALVEAMQEELGKLPAIGPEETEIKPDGAATPDNPGISAPAPNAIPEQN